jgi:hypothetical protein
MKKKKKMNVDVAASGVILSMNMHSPAKHQQRDAFIRGSTCKLLFE